MAMITTKHPLTIEQQSLIALAIVVVCTVIGELMEPRFAEANLVMVYLAGVVLAASFLGRRASVLVSVLSVAAFDFFFVHPYLTFAISDTQYVVTFAVMLLVALMISTMTAQIRQQAEVVYQREQRTSILYQLSRDFANSKTMDDLIQAAAQHIGSIFASQVSILLSDPYQKLAQTAPNKIIHQDGLAQWVYENRQSAGLGTTTIPGATALYMPLMISNQIAGVVVVSPQLPQGVFAAEQLNFLETLINQTAIAIEKVILADQAEHSRMAIESERLRNTLLSSISHDLRTPLASITGAASSLLQKEQSLEPHSRQELHQIIYEEADRLNRLVGNLLDMTRIESGGIRVKKEWELLEEIIGSTLLRLKKRLGQRELNKVLPKDLVLVPMDSVLIEQVLVNLIDNAIKYSPTKSPIELIVELQAEAVVVSVADRGIGIPTGSEERIFDKFYRAAPENVGGIGLGLAICRSIIIAHDGRIWAENRPNGGSIFRFALPLEGEPPEVTSDE